MGSESRRRLWHRPVTRWSHRAAGAAPRGRREFDAAEAQAQALCDLVADPTSGITRVTVVSAGPRLVEAIEEVAEERGLVPQGERSAADGGGLVRLERAPTATPPHPEGR